MWILFYYYHLCYHYYYWPHSSDLDYTLDDAHGLEGTMGILSEPYHVIGMKPGLPILPL